MERLQENSKVFLKNQICKATGIFLKDSQFGLKALTTVIIRNNNNKLKNVTCAVRA